jgi:hypothetical protein
MVLFSQCRVYIGGPGLKGDRRFPRDLHAFDTQLQVETCGLGSSALALASSVRYDLEDAMRCLGSGDLTLSYILAPLGIDTFTSLTRLTLTSYASSLEQKGTDCTCIRERKTKPRMPQELEEEDLAIIRVLVNLTHLTLDRIDVFANLRTLAFFLCSIPALTNLKLSRVDWAVDTIDSDKILPRNLKLTTLKIDSLSKCSEHRQTSLHAFYRWLSLTDLSRTLDMLTFANDSLVPGSAHMRILSAPDRGKNLTLHIKDARKFEFLLRS